MSKKSVLAKAVQPLQMQETTDCLQFLQCPETHKLRLIRLNPKINTSGQMQTNSKNIPRKSSEKTPTIHLIRMMGIKASKAGLL